MTRAGWRDPVPGQARQTYVDTVLSGGPTRIAGGGVPKEPLPPFVGVEDGPPAPQPEPPVVATHLQVSRCWVTHSGPPCWPGPCQYAASTAVPSSAEVGAMFGGGAS